MPSCTIIGVGTGLGAALVRRFAREGFQVAAIGRRQEVLDTALNTVDSQCIGMCRSFTADASHPASLRAALGAIEQWTGASQVLIYNAAKVEKGMASTLSASQFTADIAVNMGGALTAIESVLPTMRERRGGSILLTGGSLALDAWPEWASLGAGKAALRNYAIGLHKELKTENVHVAMVQICGTIAPGTIFDPDLIADAFWKLYGAPPAERHHELIFNPMHPPTLAPGAGSKV